MAIAQRQRVLDCGGKRSATPLSPARKAFASRIILARPKSAVAAPALPAQSKFGRPSGT